ncbi:MAG TPA: type II toxin-antitoxin system Phd/YefM family antitoxin [Chloroflexi bacterium]|nr:type II toxin-antitoxin system Phd/YefM family antitoxin [Chloroflexota bacterium]
MSKEWRVTATEAKNRFGQVIRLAQRTGQPVLVESRGEPVVVIVSVEAFERYRRAARRPGERARRAFGMWAGRTDLDETWLAQGRKRWQSRWDDDS